MRLYLRDKSEIMIQIFRMAYEHLPARMSETHAVVSSVLTLFSNLMINEKGVA